MILSTVFITANNLVVLSYSLMGYRRWCIPNFRFDYLWLKSNLKLFYVDPYCLLM